MLIIKPPVRSYLPGIALITLAIFFLSLMDVVGKWLVNAQGGYATVQILALRAGVIVTVFLFYLPFAGGLNILVTQRISQHLIRCVIGFGAPLLFFTALKSLPLANATAGFFSSTFLAVLLSAIVLKERVSIQSWFAVIGGFAGVLLVTQPGFESFQIEILLVLGSGACYAVFILMGRWMSDTEPTFRLVFYTNLVVGVCALLPLPWVWEPVSTPIAFGIVAMALLGIAGQLALTQAFRLAPVGVVAPFEYSALIWSTLFGFLFWREIPTLMVALGVLVIAASGFYLGYREWRH
jgi:EamA-like transporter family.